MSSPLPPLSSARSRLLSADATRRSLESHLSSLLSQLPAGVGMSGPLVDAEGYPRADVDVYTVRTVRQQVIMARNDLTRATDALHEALGEVHAEEGPGVAAGSSSGLGARGATPPDLSSRAGAPAPAAPFALVDAVAAGSPAAAAGFLEHDLILAWGALRSSSSAGGGSGSGSGVAGVGGGAGVARPTVADVGASVRAGEPITVVVQRGGAQVQLVVTPQRWDGLGLLGCHIVPFGGGSG